MSYILFKIHELRGGSLELLRRPVRFAREGKQSSAGKSIQLWYNLILAITKIIDVM